LVRGERRSLRKFAGIALSILSIVLLGVSGSKSADIDAADSVDSTQNSGGSGNSSDTMKLILFLTTFFAWGFADILSASIKLDTLTCICVNVVGQLLIASVTGFVVLTRLLSLLATGVLDEVGFVAPAGISFGWPHFLIMAANGLAIVGWLLFVKASQTQPLSRLIPVLSQYTLLPVVLALLFLGEELSWWKAAGMVVGAAAVLVVSTSQAEPGADASPAGKHLDQACAVEEHGPASGVASSSSAVVAPSSAQDSVVAAGAAASSISAIDDSWATSSSRYVFADPSGDMSEVDEAPTESSVAMAMHSQPRGALPAACKLDTVELLVRP
jgi:drug/metabolite transporter (DMT)-like permease